MWAAVIQKGVLLYGEADGQSGGRGEVFDPVNLAVDVTPENALKAASEKAFVKALMIAFQLNERDELNKVLEATAPDQINLIVDRISSLYFVRLVNFLSWCVESSGL